MLGIVFLVAMDGEQMLMLLNGDINKPTFITKNEVSYENSTLYARK